MKDIYSGHIENPKESPTVRNCSNQEERRHDKTLAHIINVQSITDGIKWSRKHEFDTCRAWSQGY